ncbi:MBL fold metallo-hydrolase [Clostridium fallax]|uniref:L-ascorbate metabolism protein UlaG, beta-lactamase superfamily n=1 Tax=Clostridium fallax TaxID=1533 RepID=A0A1M4TMG7_9CLOT|nr:MBL fold metallo-hydrolase [Clostridium fallax]SHE45564.1 L-ascorbate metabolism protein UlaG, beta-lactamase superfamily [Clostridium fallax]SQB22496.1 hydrolase [Clostridium fallax]
MEITWLGHSSFLIKTSNGKRILTDPFNTDIGYISFNSTVDIITISHSHFDHCVLKKEWNNSKVLNSIGIHTFPYCTIKGILSYHDRNQGVLRGENIIFLYDLDGFRICHLGDLGHSLSKEFIKSLGDIDLLLIPVGGEYTIDGLEASKIAKSISSSYIIPMHYKTNKLSFSLDGPEKFITSMNNVNKISSNSFYLTEKSKLKNQVILLSCP